MLGYCLFGVLIAHSMNAGPGLVDLWENQKKQAFTQYNDCRAACVARTKKMAFNEYTRSLLDHSSNRGPRFGETFGGIALDMVQIDCLEECRRQLAPHP